MFRAPTPKNQVKLVSEFVQAAGGTAKHTAVCEVVAKLWGAPNWNVLTGMGKKEPAVNSSLSDDELYQIVKSNTAGIQKMLRRVTEEAHISGDVAPEGWVSVFLSGYCYCEDEPTYLRFSLQEEEIRELTAEEFELLTQSGVAVEFEVEYPRSDKYGTPEEASDKGGVSFIWNDLGFKTIRGIYVNGEDRGDDGCMSYVLNVKVAPEVYEQLTATRNSTAQENLSCCKECGISLEGSSNWQGLCYACALDEGLVDNHVPGERNLPDYVADEIPFHWEYVFIHGTCYLDPKDGDITISFERDSDTRVLSGDELQAVFDSGIAVCLDVNYPNSAKYGTPEEAGHRGGQAFVEEELGFKTSRDFEVNGNDTGDDSGMHYVLEVAIPPELYANLSSC